MKKLFVAISAALLSMGAYAQGAQQAAADAAKAMDAAPAVEVKVEKPKLWTNTLKTNVTLGQTSLNNWAAGGDNTVSLAAYVDGNANWKHGDMFWNNRLQLDYGFLWASSKPILQKNMDRIYLESKWGYKAPSTKYLYFSANYDFKSQFSSGYDYKTPASVTDENGTISRDLILEMYGVMPVSLSRDSLLRHIRILRSVLTSFRQSGSLSTLRLLQVTS